MIYLPHIMVSIFAVVPIVRTVHNGQNSIQYYGSLTWNIIVGYIKDSETLYTFKSKKRK